MTSPRTKRLAPRLLAVLIAIGLACPILSPASEIVLVSGDVIEGQIIESTASTVTVRTVDRVMTLPRSRIAEVRESAPGAAELQLADENLRRGEFDKARQYVGQARQAGATDEALQEMRFRIDDRESESQLARHASLIEAARRAAERGVEDTSIAELRDLLKTLPEGSGAASRVVEILCDLHLRRAAEHRDRVRYREAAAELQKALTLDPERANAYLELADIYKISTATWPQALANYQRTISLGEDAHLAPAELTRAHWEMAEINRQQSDWKNAAINYRAVWLRDPQFNLRLTQRLVDAMREYAATLETTNPAAGLLVVEEALKVRREYEFLMMRGRMLRAQGKLDESTRAFRELIAEVDQPKGAHFYIAQNLLDQGDTLRGREMLQKEIETDPKNYEALCQLGEFALQRDDYTAAEEFFTSAHDADPDIPRASLGLGKTYRFKGELERAREFVQEVLARLPDDREAVLEMGRTYRDEAILAQLEADKRRNLETAGNYFTKVLELLDSVPEEERAGLQQLKADALLARGEIRLLRDGPATAQVDFERALEALPGYSTAYYNIGVAYRAKFASSKRLDDLKKAEESLIKARDLDATNPQYALELGIMYSQELAQIDPVNRDQYVRDAIRNMEKYIELGGANSSQVRAWIAEIRS